jgi:predicted MPP superfamily phosphohydrolase
MKCVLSGSVFARRGRSPRRVDGDGFSILLKHKPYLDPIRWTGTTCRFRAHSWGQIFPFFLATRTKYPHYTGMYRPTGASRTLLYVSPGTGTWGPPMRLFARRK